MMLLLFGKGYLQSGAFMLRCVGKCEQKGFGVHREREVTVADLRRIK